MSAEQSVFEGFSGNEEVPEEACKRYKQCENIVPENEGILQSYLNKLRAAGRERHEEASRL
ncbi:hypothetical protein [Halococcus sp. IIIV-5B]|uniref:hypothetical protein n=1 Tax=Halococcus sp. IIIV-5B TaxID=2321230 RepID=UPI000E765EC1|nr:hypothetical protein [Halococcus sp. IIIV-5B]RJT07503.1 hypothetical protein D3261_02575 [Halococcus sp. IIIV-5B]